MYIVYENNENNIEQLRSKYLVLELDSIEIKPKEFVTAFCIIDNEHIQLQEMALMNDFSKIHESLIHDYKSKNWESCYEGIDKLTTKFKGEMDSFYDVLLERIKILETSDLADDWTGRVSTSKEII